MAAACGVRMKEWWPAAIWLQRVLSGDGPLLCANSGAVCFSVSLLGPVLFWDLLLGGSIPKSDYICRQYKSDGNCSQYGDR